MIKGFGVSRPGLSQPEQPAEEPTEQPAEKAPAETPAERPTLSTAVTLNASNPSEVSRLVRALSSVTEGTEEERMVEALRIVSDDTWDPPQEPKNICALVEIDQGNVWVRVTPWNSIWPWRRASDGRMATWSEIGVTSQEQILFQGIQFADGTFTPDEE